MNSKAKVNRLLTVLLFVSVASVSAVSVSVPSSVGAQDAPGFAKEPVVTEYDVDPSWPKVPKDVSSKGWVSGMAIDAEENIWFFKKGPDPVQVYAPNGDFVRTWGKGSFVDPHHIRIDHEENIWVADFGQHIIQKYTPKGELLQTIGVAGEKGDDEHHFYRPTDMAIAKNGDLFVTDGYGNRRIVHLTKEGRFIKSWGVYGSKPGQFILPHAITMDSKGTLYVADRNSGRIQVFSQEGKLLDQWANVIMPWGLSTTKDDEIWVCGSSPHWWKRHGKYQEYKDQLFVRFSTDGRVRQLWTLPMGEPGKTKPGETVGAHCIVKDSKGNIYVGDIYGERAQKFVPVTSR